ncbi:hypothetical protein [Mesorhizobium sp. M1406]|uniref:hypothetical protein n=1 Tax=Mesorhizobium sp. M1406 TaxID=2957099 RepID=UPI003337E49F
MSEELNDLTAVQLRQADRKKHVCEFDACVKHAPFAFARPKRRARTRAGKAL